MKLNYSIILIAAFSALIYSCKKDPKKEPEPTNQTGSIAIHFENMVGDSDLVLNTKSYTNQNGDTFTVSKFKYYISNIKLTKSDGSVFTEPESYHLIDQAVAGSMEFTIPNVPVGNYTAISLMLGVDSLRNVSGAQTGALDPANGMFWSWSTGYIMAKLEGNSPQSSAAGNDLTFHIGGFGGATKAQRIATPFFNGDQAQVSTTVTPEIHLKADVLEWFKSPTVISFSTTSFIMSPNSTSVAIANNYSDMLTVEHIHN